MAGAPSPGALESPPPPLWVKRVALIRFPTDEVGDAGGFATKLDELRRAHPDWRVEGVVDAANAREGPSPPGSPPPFIADVVPMVPHRPYLRRRQLEVPNRSAKGDRHRKAREYVLETELHGLARPPTCDDAELSSSDGDVVPRHEPAQLARGRHVLIEVPPHQNQRGTITDFTNPDCFKVSFPDGASWWCSQDEVTLLPDATASRSVSLSTFEELARLKDERELLLTALEACGDACYAQRLPAADAARVETLLARKR
eukprot:TRINITY_DN26176_c0_g1_i1.p1 TRINITY_DN26176_c0_g1~~TRINITY_DN26176_c0_g1_i1.p1  ORF type:complete len:258 (+),score=61.82 TRINITY_DN26176_c0_g1_i1:49-822(+)